MERKARQKTDFSQRNAKDIVEEFREEDSFHFQQRKVWPSIEPSLP